MSRLFEALQRSEGDAVSFEFSDSAELTPAALASLVEPEVTPLADLLKTAGPEGADFGQFQSLRIAIDPDSRIVTVTDKESLGAEKFRFLSVRLRQLQQTRVIKKLLITSSMSEEGKSTVSANLAVTLARKRQQRVLLLEGDLRRPTLTHHFGLNKLQGLCEWLPGSSKPLPDIYFLEGGGFWFLPAGSPPENPLELMQSGRLAELLERLSGWFDWIVIDSPPVLPLADTTVWSRMADGILLVTRQGTTQKRQLQRGIQVIDAAKVLGVVLNACSDTDHQNYYQRYAPATPSKQ